MRQAVVFDFDGLILDTETPLFEAWRLTFEGYGVDPISLADWADSIGRADDDPEIIDPVLHLEARLGRSLDAAEVQNIRRARRDELLDAQPLQPGVESILDEAERDGIGVAIATSAPSDWIERHLLPRGLLHRFPVVSCAGDGVPGKPHPATYLNACEQLRVPPAAAIALEDSTHGVRAAKAAGMFCIAVPTAMGRGLDYSHADQVVSSLSEVVLRDALRRAATAASRS